jgi:hypothetical protein
MSCSPEKFRRRWMFQPSLRRFRKLSNVANSRIVSFQRPIQRPGPGSSWEKLRSRS